MPVAWIESVLDLFFPPACLTCRRRIRRREVSFPFCPSCRESFSLLGYFCLRCNITGPDGLPCSCRPGSGAVKWLYGLAWYEGRWREVLHNFKYRSRPQMADTLGGFLGKSLAGQARRTEPDFITSVPLHPQREKERGYNQSSLLAVRAGKELGVPFKPLLARTRNTASQTSLTRRERITNMTGAFIFTGKTAVTGKSVLIVDDIYTTGSTIQEAARVLKNAGAREVCAAVMAIQGKTRGSF